jgi:hypothetical protein
VPAVEFRRILMVAGFAMVVSSASGNPYPPVKSLKPAF